jgi:hypothetical protein
MDPLRNFGFLLRDVSRLSSRRERPRRASVQLVRALGGGW